MHTVIAISQSLRCLGLMIQVIVEKYNKLTI